jgi:hypothetical protein
MSEMIRRTKLERFVKRLEAKIPVLSKEKSEVIKEVVADIKHEFKLEGEKK